MKLIYLADTHWGHPDAAALPELLQALARWLREHPGPAFVLHGGDLVQRLDPYLIRQAAAIFRLPVPVYLCPGASDLGEGAEAIWLEDAPTLFPEASLTWALELDGILLQAVGPTPEALAPFLAERTGTRRILCTHQPLLGAVRSGGGTLADHLLRNRCLLGFLASHNHLSSHVRRDEISFLSVGSFIRPPHPFLVVTIDASGILDSQALELSTAAPDVAPRMDATYTRHL